MPKLQNAAMMVFRQMNDPNNERPPAFTRREEGTEKSIEALIELVQRVYSDTAANNPLRPLCVKTLMWITRGPAGAGEQLFERFIGPGLGMDVIKEFLKIPMKREKYYDTFLKDMESMVPE